MTPLELTVWVCTLSFGLLWRNVHISLDISHVYTVMLKCMKECLLSVIRL